MTQKLLISSNVVSETEIQDFLNSQIDKEELPYSINFELEDKLRGSIDPNILAAVIVASVEVISKIIAEISSLLIQRYKVKTVVVEDSAGTVYNISIEEANNKLKEILKSNENLRIVSIHISSK